ncbi:short-chain dehydrogenase reductase [Fusarium albosuccineum]|uniref:Short-chain dehydrogenase reductase n=1 Tax=Fusarium albosuccineum TaxID=1237068 RepID=A0A8H4L6M7_9HYPO|nr:short-chain dehydrogenase reductase [Fusarium albosuccineum]
MTGANFRSEDIPHLSGQVIIVTGGNAGLGLETIKQLSQHNPARIYLAARSQDKAEAAIRQIKEAHPNASPISFLQLDLASFASMRAAAETFTKASQKRAMRFNGTNVMGPALFSQLLLRILQNTAKINPQTRVVILASASEKMASGDAYQLEELKTTMPHRNTTARYTLSKLADIHYATAMAERHHDVKFLSVHPGMVATNLHHNSTGLFLRPFLYSAGIFATPVEKGALSQIWAAVSPDAKAGEYYGPVGVAGKGSKATKNRELQEKIFKWIQDELQGHL